MDGTQDSCDGVVFGSICNGKCPRCGALSIPSFRGAVEVTAVMCQNPSCQLVIEKSEVFSYTG